MEAKLRLIPWLVSVIYGSIPLFWFAIHPFADFWRRMRRSPYLLLLPIWAVIILALAWATSPWHTLQLYYPSHSWWLLLACQSGWIAGLSLRIYWRIRSGFGTSNFIGETELRSQDEASTLVTTGMHAQMRHPIYTAHLLMMTAWAIGSGLLAPFILLAASLFITFPLMVWVEERELEQRFGTQYREYKQKVPLFSMPFFLSPDGKKPA